MKFNLLIESTDNLNSFPCPLDSNYVQLFVANHSVCKDIDSISYTHTYILFTTCTICKVKASNAHKGPYDFDLLVPIQELGGERLVSKCIEHNVCEINQ